MENNKEIWNRVCKTNPDHTKHVNQRGGFTSVDAHYQIESATAEFGPVGIGWGYTVEYGVIEAKVAMLATADVILWHGSRENCFGPWRGMAEIVDSKGRVDDDAAKKATTDAITKALSHLGFNADVFLGKFDDNKYVAQLRKEFSGDGKKQGDATKKPAEQSTLEAALFAAGKKEPWLIAEAETAGWSGATLAAISSSPDWQEWAMNLIKSTTETV